MKICQLLSNQFLNDNRVFRSCKTLEKAGHEVVLLCIRDGKEKLPEYEDGDHFLVKRVVNWLPFLPKNRAELSLMKTFYKVAVSERADVYHANDLDTLLIAYLAARKNKSKVVYDSHEFWYDKTWSFYSGKDAKIYKSYSRILERFLIKRVSRIVTVGDALADELRRIYHLKNRPYVVSNFTIRKEIKRNEQIRIDMGAKESDKIIVYVGVLVRGRGLEKLMDAVQLLSPEYKIGVVGYGYLEEELKEMVKKKGLSRRYFFLGAKNYKEVPEYLCGADLGIAPIENICTSYYFSTPNKISEFVMAGLPVVCSNFPGMQPIIEKLKIGAVFNPEKPEEIALCVKGIFESKERYDSLKKNVEKARGILCWEYESKKLINLYESL